MQSIQFSPCRRVEKIGSGIRHFMVRETEEGEYAVKTRCFSIVRMDGSLEDFSYVKCIRQLFWDTDREWSAPVADASTEGGIAILKVWIVINCILLIKSTLQLYITCDGWCLKPFIAFVTLRTWMGPCAGLFWSRGLPL